MIEMMIEQEMNEGGSKCAYITRVEILVATLKCQNLCVRASLTGGHALWQHESQLEIENICACMRVCVCVCVDLTVKPTVYICVIRCVLFFFRLSLRFIHLS